MGSARPSTTGITPHVYGSEPTERSSSNEQAIKSLGDSQAGVVVRNNDFPRPSVPGSKVAGATTIRGGRGGA